MFSEELAARWEPRPRMPGRRDSVVALCIEVVEVLLPSAHTSPMPLLLFWRRLPDVDEDIEGGGEWARAATGGAFEELIMRGC